ncbi:MAG: gliding motility-associated C-terminal domain-containing protein [Bacteroidota bacterium]
MHRKRPCFRKYLLVFFLVVTSGIFTDLLASHIRAAEIFVERVSGRRYKFTLIGIRDSEDGLVDFGLGVFSFGDNIGRITNLRNDPRDEAGNLVDIDRTTRDLGGGIEVNTFVFEYTYASVQPRITVSYTENFRNDFILNLGAPPDGNGSDEIPFHVETQFSIDPAVGVNNSPRMGNLPIDKGGQYVTFFHNPAAFDPDPGDSISFRLAVPKRSLVNPDGALPGIEIDSYRDPNTVEFYEEFAIGNEARDGEPTFEIDPVTGLLTWDAPDKPGEYNVAFIVDEWKKIGGEFVRVGFVTRDMQIVIEPTENERPEVIVPDPICVVAGTLIEEIFVGSDPDGHDILIEAFGEPFAIAPTATVSPEEFRSQPSTAQFSWQTDCRLVRERPYEVVVKITDRPPLGPALVNFATWEITVVAPAPDGLQADIADTRSIDLSWNDYDCGNADSIEIWRRVDSFNFEPDECETGMPAFAGYELIELVDVQAIAYQDDDNGDGLSAGATYCYRLVARFPEPGGGFSIVSEEVCDSIPAVRPVITHVDVNATNQSEGEVIIRWETPFDLDPIVAPLPYEYEVLRIDPQGEVLSLLRTLDQQFVDTGLNTQEQSYSYRIVARDNNGVLLDTSSMASSVWLEPTPELNAITLRWMADVPWSNFSQRFPYHYIYRDNTSDDAKELVLIDSVSVSSAGLQYVDDGRFNGEPLSDDTEYCYYIVTQGTYGNPGIDEPLLNRSQVVCSQPNDVIAPCEPLPFTFDPAFDCEAVVRDQPCDFNEFTNHLLWEADSSTGCQDDIVGYNVYFSNTGEEGSFEVIATVAETEFYHRGLSSFKGCYKISSLDRSGNESELTEADCRDNCPNYELPNAFSPNNDGQNDTFTPFYSSPSNPIFNFDNNRCPRFVQRVVFQVVDRTGNQLFLYDSRENEGSTLINWKGVTSTGTELPAGTYYYYAEVTYDVLNPEKKTENLKGWVQLFR